jgi:uncharacterized protein
MTLATSRILGLTAAAACVALAGCSILAPQRDPSRFFTLSPLTDQGSPDAAGSTKAPPVTYGLGPVTLPAYLDRNEIAARVQQTEIVYSAKERWAEPLRTEVARTLLQNLSTLLSTDRMVPWPAAVPVDRQIVVDFLRFERVDASSSQLVATWSVKDLHSGQLLAAKESSFNHTAASSSATDTVSALSADLADLSREIAQVVQGLTASAPTAGSGRRTAR